ncbi:MAG: hypothetical protein N2235_03155 [Fischerella sp.]|nr:hypothetical protein [Fischerella sp.]
MHNRIFEGLEYGDLKRLVKPLLGIDKFKSKMGDDKDIIVLSFEIAGKEPALDLTNFAEKGYKWILDADTSSGELDNGDYVVFLELARSPAAVENIIEFMEDLMNLTEQSLDEWVIAYYRNKKYYPFSIESLRSLLPLTPKEYDRRYGKKVIDDVKTAAGVKVSTKAPKNSHTESIRTLAGIIR